MSFIEKIRDNTFDSILEVPTSGSPDHNAMLTITLRYQLIFADSKNKIPGLIVERDGTTRAVDNVGYSHPITDWDAKTRSDFTRAMSRSEKIWNLKFMLIPPLDYSDLDFPHPHPGWYVHPNVICLFRLEPSGTPHIR